MSEYVDEETKFTGAELMRDRADRREAFFFTTIALCVTAGVITLIVCLTVGTMASSRNGAATAQKCIDDGNVWMNGSCITSVKR